MTKGKKYTFSTGVVILAIVVGLMSGLLLAGPLGSTGKGSSLYAGGGDSRLNAIMQIVSRYYVDQVDYDSLSTVAVRSMLSSLDPHSTYLSIEDYDKEAELLHGRFEGIGVVLFVLNDTVYASNVRKDGPAGRAGIIAGDRILMVDTVKVSGVELEGGSQAVVNLIRGPRFSNVTLTIDRAGWDTPRKVKIRRDVIQHASIPAAVMIDRKTGYVHVSRFAETTCTEFHEALKQLLKQGMEHLVLDLRGNGGGSLESAVRMADELLPKGDLIVYTEGAHDRRRNFYASSGGLFEEGRLTVLINEYSASASEVVSGAIQDNDRGIIAGRCSFGKGLVQRQFDLPDGDAVLLTIARYYSPSGRCIQRPYQKGSDAYYMDYLNRIFSNYSSADSLFNAIADTSQQYLTKKGRKVYGGGGIQPDVTLPYVLDTNWAYYNKLIDKQVLEEVMYHYIHDNYAQLAKRYPTENDFVNRYQVDDATWQRILLTAEAKGIKPHAGCLKKYAAHIRNRYKALMAMALYDDNAYYRVSLLYDHELQKAVKENKSAL